MRIAIARMGRKVAQHFGHCEDFVLYDIENNKIINQSFLPNPEHQPGFLPGFLKKQGVNVIIAGGMGQKAIDLFNLENIKVITGATGNTDEVISAYLQGNLTSTNQVCKHEHDTGHSCSH